MAQQSDDNPAKPLMDLYKKWTGKGDKPAPAPKPDTSWHDEQVRKANEGFAKAAQDKQQGDKKPAPTGKVPSYKKGGKIRKTGLALVHKGERMIPKGKVKGVEKAMAQRKRG